MYTGDAIEDYSLCRLHLAKICMHERERISFTHEYDTFSEITHVLHALLFFRITNTLRTPNNNLSGV